MVLGKGCVRARWWCKCTLHRWRLTPPLAPRSTPWRRPVDETQETLRTSAFPSVHIKEKWSKDLYVAGLAFGRTVC